MQKNFTLALEAATTGTESIQHYPKIMVLIERPAKKQNGK
jgi:hypothetical protein